MYYAISIELISLFNILFYHYNDNCLKTIKYLKHKYFDGIMNVY